MPGSSSILLKENQENTSCKLQHFVLLFCYCPESGCKVNFHHLHVDNITHPWLDVEVSIKKYPAIAKKHVVRMV